MGNEEDIWAKYDPHNRRAGVHDVLLRKLLRVLTAMDALGFTMRVTDGLRTTEQQQELYAQGRTKPGKKVTNADGVVTRSNHQAYGDGFGHAVDCCFLDDHGVPTWREDFPWRCYGETGKAVGLKWGGDWNSPHDLPHLELPRLT